jgi:hypothetical protein
MDRTGKLLGSIEGNTLIGMRGRALIRTMVYSFAGVGAAVTMEVGAISSIADVGATSHDQRSVPFAVGEIDRNSFHDGKRGSSHALLTGARFRLQICHRQR